MRIITVVLAAVTGLLVSACSGAIADDNAKKATGINNGKAPDGDAGAVDAGSAATPDSGASPLPPVDQDAGAGDACLADCRARFPGGVSASSLILYSCGTTCGTNGVCGTQNLFGSSAECSSCMLSSTGQSCVAAFDMCNTDKVCAAFSSCVRDCESAPMK